MRREKRKLIREYLHVMSVVIDWDKGIPLEDESTRTIVKSRLGELVMLIGYKPRCTKYVNRLNKRLERLDKEG